VYLSRFGSVAGVPVALGGLIWFGLAALIAGFAKPDEKRSLAAGYLFALSLIGLAVALYLAYASFFVLGTGCLLCIGTYACVLGIFLLSSFTNAESIASLPARLFGDLGSLVSQPVTLGTAVLFLTGAASVVAFFPREGSAAAQAAASAAPAADAQQAFADAWAKQPRVDLGIPADGAKVIIVKFNDFECPTCAQFETFYRPVLQKFAASHPGAIKYVVKDYPWDTKCNFNSARTIPGHEAACDAAAAARMARERGKYDEMTTWLYANQGARPDAVRAAAARILGVTDFDREYALQLPAIRADIADGGVLRVSGTPTYFINGVKVPLLAAQQFELAITLELQKAGS
jgi:protein-disulfide isomerase